LFTPTKKESAKSLGQELKGKKLKLEKWRPPKDNLNWDHDHCEICGKEISNSNHAENEGYTDKDYFYWICKSCFKKYKKELGIS